MSVDMMTIQQSADELGLTLERYMMFEKHTLKKVKKLLHHKGINHEDIPNYDDDTLLGIMRVYEPVKDETDLYIDNIDYVVSYEAFVFKDK
jgi:hypothetical protein